MNKSRIFFFTKTLVHIDMLIDLPNQILMERPSYAFITDLEYEKLASFVLLVRWLCSWKL